YFVLEEIGANDAIRGQTSLRVAYKPERLYIFSADLVDDRGNDVLKVHIVIGGPDSGRRIWRGDDQPILVLVVHDRKVVALPVAVGPGPVKAEDEGDLFTGLQITGIVEEVSAGGLHLDHRPLIYPRVRRTVFVRTMEDGRRCAGGSRQFYKLVLRGRARVERGDGCD